MTNCDELPGRLKDLCRGHDDDGKPVGDAKKRKAWKRYFQDGEHAEVVRRSKLTRKQREADRLQRSRDWWLEFHLYAIRNWDHWDEVDARKWFSQHELLIPRYGCSCRKNWKSLKVKLPPVFRSAAEFFDYTVEAHNRVNHELGKPQFPVETALEWYRSIAH